MKPIILHIITLFCVLSSMIYAQSNHQLITFHNVENYNALNIGPAYKGNVAYVVADSTVYQFDGNQWITFCRDQYPSKFYLGQDTLGGIVAYLYEDENNEEHGFVISKLETNTSWQVYQYPMPNISTDYTNGQQNTNNMNNSPAKDWIINNLGSDWFLPAPNELHKIYQNLLHINPALQDLGLTTISEKYWSSHQQI